ncbi:MAG: hypothetical protein COU69_01590 [Candidatus Pacebacteria bacterium CG10_big_fil_rev_8_21_14_0_10_56_10]|nr:MAG: hypothetical protein COU69_01590 [Candidatus Pacebacteria bacterium CG10_big_fil_rev_8_21_14_0_10_56_10]
METSRVFSPLVMLVLMVVLGAGLRFYRLGSLPLILNRDEAALAYNAVLLNQTGLDEWQRNWPLALESFGDFKLVGYPAVLAGVFGILEPSDWTVRLPSALAGISLIGLTYLLGRRLGLYWPYALLWSLTVAISPVFMFYSRIAFEANLALALMVASLVVFLWPSASTNKRHLLDAAAAGLWLMAMLTYNAPLLLAPFLMLSLVLVRGARQFKAWLVPVVLLTVLAGGVYGLLRPVTAQKQAVTLLGDEAVQLEWAEYRSGLAKPLRPWLGQKLVFVLPRLLNNTLGYVSPGFLVTNGGQHPWHSLPGRGHLYWPSYLLGLGGAAVAGWRLVSWRWTDQSLGHKPSRAQLLWIVMTPAAILPGIITVDAPHATRALLFFVLLAGWSAYALQELAGWLKQWRPQLPSAQLDQLLVGGAVLVVLISSVEYLQSYFTRFETSHPPSLQIGFDRHLRQVEQRYPDGPIAVVDSQGFQYILTAWYLRLPPDEFFATVVKQQPDQIGLRYGERLDRYHFIAHPADRSEDERVLVEWTGQEWRSRVP